MLSWLIAFFEYLLELPANRIGPEQFSRTQLKIVLGSIPLVVFLAYASVGFGKPIRWNTSVSMTLVVAAVFFAFIGKK